VNLVGELKIVYSQYFSKAPRKTKEKKILMENGNFYAK